MAKRKLNVTLTGEAPMLMHNGQLADPLNKIVKAMKQITAKGKNKTEADLIKLSELEFKGGLYLDSKQKNIEIPSHLLEATVKAGAKATRKGKIAEQGVFVNEWAAQAGLAILFQLFIHKEVKTPRIYFDSLTGRMNPVYITKEIY